MQVGQPFLCVRMGLFPGFNRDTIPFMKTIIALLFCFVVICSAAADESSSTIAFGLKWKASKETVISEMLARPDVQLKEKKDTNLTFTSGTFAGKRVNWVIFDFYKDQLYSIMICIDSNVPTVDWNDVYISLSKKYRDASMRTPNRYLAWWSFPEEQPQVVISCLVLNGELVVSYEYKPFSELAKQEHIEQLPKNDL